MNRKERILQAIVADYVNTQEPVGSKILVEKYGFNVSSATVRKEMAELEEQGFLLSPHKSAGRIPTNKGYRAFVDMLSEIKPLSTPERQAITKFLTSSLDLDTVLNRAVQLLSNLTKQVAIVQYPILSVSKILHLELVLPSVDRLIVILIADTGRVEQHLLELDSDFRIEEIEVHKRYFQEKLCGKSIAEATSLLAEQKFDIFNKAYLKDDWERIKLVLLEMLLKKTDTKILLGGTANLAKNIKDFSNDYDTMLSILDDLEEQMVLLRIMNMTNLNSSANDKSSVSVKIGEENAIDSFKPTSIITSKYGSEDTSYGNIGIVGPTRMDYPDTIAKVVGVAHYIGQILFTK